MKKEVLKPEPKKVIDPTKPVQEEKPAEGQAIDSQQSVSEEKSDEGKETSPEEVHINYLCNGPCRDLHNKPWSELTLAEMLEIQATHGGL
ncbi:MAG: hypothetical protein V1858_04375 [Candidatus Gottesmanbacteria bacterium]